jgi:chromate transport protein ChrA
MFRFVDTAKGQWILSWTSSGLTFIAVVFFGAPPVTLFYVLVALLVFTGLAERQNEREKRRKR